VNACNKAIAATHHGLDDRIANYLPQVTHVRAQQALAHDNLAPDCLDELVLRHQALGVGGEVLQDREWLPPKLQLDAVSP